MIEVVTESLAHVGNIAVLFSVATLVYSSVPAVQRERRIAEARDVIKAQEGRKQDGGRIAALELLHNSGESLEGLVAEEAYLWGVTLPTRANLYRATLNGAVLNNAVLNKAILVEAKLVGAEFNDAVLDYANLTDATLQDDKRGADFTDAHLNHATLPKDLSRVVFRDAELKHVTFVDNTQLTDTDLRGAKLFHSNCPGMDFSEAKVSGADFTRANLAGANFKSVDLSDAILNLAGLRGANLRGANLRDADLRLTLGLKDAKLGGAFYNDETEFPEGFDPVAVGMLKTAE